MRATGFVSVGQAGDQRMQLIAVLDEPRQAVRMHHRIVPGGHHLAAVLLGGIPARCHISLRAVEDDHAGGGPQLPNRIRAGHVADQGAVFAAGGVQVQGQVVDDRLALGHAHPRGQGVIVHQCLQGLGVLLFEVAG